MKKLWVIAALLLSANLYAQKKLNEGDLKELKNRLEGNFDNQSEAPKGKASILHIKEFSFPKAKKTLLKKKSRKPVEVETDEVEDNGGYWLYLEQAAVTNSDKISAQWVINIYLDEKKRIVCKMYELDNAADVARAWEDDEKLGMILKKDLSEDEDCMVSLVKDNLDNFKGKGSNPQCKAAEWTVYDSMLVLGSAKEKYKFIKYRINSR